MFDAKRYGEGIKNFTDPDESVIRGLVEQCGGFPGEVVTRKASYFSEPTSVLTKWIDHLLEVYNEPFDPIIGERPVDLILLSTERTIRKIKT